MSGAGGVAVASAAWLFAAAFGASALGGVLGMASGIFIVPILTLGFGLGIRVAIGASIVSVIACSCGSAAPFLRGGLTNVRLAIVLETATTAGALTGVFLMGLVPAPALYLLFAAILAVSAQQMLARRREPALAVTVLPAAEGVAGGGGRGFGIGNEARRAGGGSGGGGWATALQLHGSYPDRALGREVGYRVERLPLGLALMYGAGLISALLGIGSGVLKIPAMDTALRLPIKVSSATSNFMIGVTAAASAGAYFVRGIIDPGVAGPVALGSVAGALLGAKLLMGLSGDKLRVFFVVVLIGLAIQMLLSALGIHLGSGGGGGGG